MCILFAGSNGYVDGWLHQHTLIVFPLRAVGSSFFQYWPKLGFSLANNKSLENFILYSIQLFLPFLKLEINIWFEYKLLLSLFREFQ